MAETVLGLDDLRRMQRTASQVFVHHALVDYVVRLVVATRAPREHGMDDVASWVSYGASPRASLGLIAASRALALVRGRDYVLPQDVLDITVDVLRHRLVLSYDALADGVPADHVVKRILQTVPLPQVTPRQRAGGFGPSAPGGPSVPGFGGPARVRSSARRPAPVRSSVPPASPVRSRRVRRPPPPRPPVPRAGWACPAVRSDRRGPVPTATGADRSRRETAAQGGRRGGRAGAGRRGAPRPAAGRRRLPEDGAADAAPATDRRPCADARRPAWTPGAGTARHRTSPRARPTCCSSDWS